MLDLITEVKFATSLVKKRKMTPSLLLILWTVSAGCFSLGLCREIPRPSSRSAESLSAEMASREIQRDSLVGSSQSLNESQVVVVVINPGTTNSTMPRSEGSAAERYNEPDRLESAHLNKRRLIRGSKRAATITKKEYLKKDWCRTEPFVQIVNEKGCLKKRIMNRFCYGQCNSFFIPKTHKKDQDGGSFRSCAYCTPIESEWMDVELECPALATPLKTKRVRIVKRCKCMAVNLDATIAYTDKV